jgi:hypothetical protein
MLGDETDPERRNQGELRQRWPGLIIFEEPKLAFFLEAAVALVHLVPTGDW